MRIPESSADRARLAAIGAAVASIEKARPRPGGLLTRYDRGCKRLTDLIISVSGLLVLMPVAVAAAVAS